MTSFPIFNGKDYSAANFLDYGYNTLSTAGTGDANIPLWQCAFIDAIADAGRQMRATSVTSNNIGTGTKTFVLALDMPFGANESIQIFDTTNRANNMFGTVTSYTSATKTLVVNITIVSGSGSSLVSWAINACGPQGATGSAGASFDQSAATADTYANMVSVGSTSGAGSGNNTKLSKSVLAAGLAGDATLLTNIFGKQNIWCPAGFIRPSSAVGSNAVATVVTASNQPDIYSLDFDPTTQWFAQFSIRMPEAWDLGTVTAQFVWSHAATTTNFGVVWNMQAVAVSSGDTIAQAYGTAQQVTSTGGTTNMQYISAATSAITIAASPAAGDMVYFRVSRVAADGSDTMAINARLHGVVLGITTTKGKDA